MYGATGKLVIDPGLISYVTESAPVESRGNSRTRPATLFIIGIAIVAMADTGKQMLTTRDLLPVLSETYPPRIVEGAMANGITTGIIAARL